jgi:hypothetical protein
MAHCKERISATKHRLGNKSNIGAKFSEVQVLFLSDQSIKHILRDCLSSALSSYNPPEDHIVTSYPVIQANLRFSVFFPFFEASNEAQVSCNKVARKQW